MRIRRPHHGFDPGFCTVGFGKTLALKWNLLLLLASCLGWAGPIQGQAEAPPGSAGASEPDYYLRDGHAVPAAVFLDILGVQALPGVSGQDLADALVGFGFGAVEGLGGRLFSIVLGDTLSRPDLIQLARDVLTQTGSLISRTGLVLRLTGWPQPVVVSDELIVQFSPGLAPSVIDSLNAHYWVEVLRPPGPHPNNYLLRTTERSPGGAISVSQIYQASGLVAFAHPNFLYSAVQLGARGSGPLNSDQWHLHNTGQTGGTPDADIDAPEAWTVSTGKPEVLIAILEYEGFDTTHVDLRANLWKNPWETDDGDDDGDPFEKKDDIRGWNFEDCSLSGADLASCGDRNIEGNPLTVEDEDTNTETTYSALTMAAHGTAVAGIIAADDNTIGLTGVCPDCRILPIRIGRETDVETEIHALDYVVKMGARVLNYSRMVLSTDAMELAIGAAVGEGVVPVFSTCYPWWCKPLCTQVPQDIATLDDVITVGYTTEDDVAATDGSSEVITGTCLDVVAPGINIATTDPTGSHGSNSADPLSKCIDEATTPEAYTFCFRGTSAAAPVVSGVAGLVLSLNPGLAPQKVEDILEKTADKTDLANSGGGIWSKDAAGNPFFSEWYGFGRVNACRAVLFAQDTGKSPPEECTITPEPKDEDDPECDDPPCDVDPGCDDPPCDIDPVCDDPPCDIDPVCDDPPCDIDPGCDDPPCDIDPVCDDPPCEGDQDEAGPPEAHRAELGALAGLTMLKGGPRDRTVVGAPGGGPLAFPAFYAAWPIVGPGTMTVETQFGLEWESIKNNPDRTAAELGLQLAYHFSAPSPGFFVGGNLGFHYLNQGSSTTDWALGTALGYRFLPKTFLAIRLEGRVRYWFGESISETGLAVGAGVVLH